MKKVVLLFSLIAMLTIQANAQKKKSFSNSDPSNYTTALGVRLNPWIVGFTIRHFIQGPHAIEGLVTTNHSKRNNVTITGLYEYNWNIGLPELNMYVGGGAHLGFYDRQDYDWSRYEDKHYKNGTYVSPGLDGIIGVEYTFKKFPLNISADLKPYVQFVGPTNYMGEEIGGVSARYTF